MTETIEYEIRVRDVLDEKWAAYFAPFTLTTETNETILRGVAHDQAELFGTLLKIRDLGLWLVSVNPRSTMKIITSTWEQVNLQEIAVLVSAARPDKVQQEGLTVETIAERFRSFFSENPAKILLAYSSTRLIGLLVLYIQNPEVLELNPGQLLGGHPIVAPGQDEKVVGAALIETAIALAQKDGFSRMELAVAMKTDTPEQNWYEEHGFKVNARYVEMKHSLAETASKEISLPSGLMFEPLGLAAKEDIYQCYYHAFKTGDAPFFFEQGEQERREYFETLGYEDALNEPASVIVLRDQQLIGFSFVLPFGEMNCHISCMCIAAEFRRKGLGELLLHNILAQAARQGCQSITLGTDVRMGAYKLYEKNNFKVTDGNIIWQWRD